MEPDSRSATAVAAEPDVLAVVLTLAFARVRPTLPPFPIDRPL